MLLRHKEAMFLIITHNVSTKTTALTDIAFSALGVKRDTASLSMLISGLAVRVSLCPAVGPSVLCCVSAAASSAHNS